MLNRITCFFILLYFCISSVFAATIRIPEDKATIQAGIDAAIDGDTVLVSNGTYQGNGNVNLDFKGKAITVKSSGGANNCVIDCQSLERTRGIYFHNKETQSSIFDGFTIMNGNHSSGGGILCKIQRHL